MMRGPLLLFLLLAVATARPKTYPKQGYQKNATLIASCYNARVVDNNNKFCSFASWPAARLYNTRNFSVYTGGTSLSDLAQNSVAMTLFSTYQGAYSQPNADCRTALQRLACVTAFPRCKLAGATVSSIGSFPPCRLQCEQANAVCGRPVSTCTGPTCSQGLAYGAFPTANCERYPTHDCLLSVPSGFFVVDPAEGPYEPLLIIYAVVMVSWYSCFTLVHAPHPFHAVAMVSWYSCFTLTHAPHPSPLIPHTSFLIHTPPPGPLPHPPLQVRPGVGVELPHLRAPRAHLRHLLPGRLGHPHTQGAPYLAPI